MTENEIRQRLSAFSTTAGQLPYTVVAYATGFPPATYVYAAPIKELPMLYAAPMPEEDIKWPDVYQPWTIKPIKPEDVPNPPKVEPAKVDKCELDELIEAVLDLKGQSVEIYRLKAVAIGIKERNENSNKG